MNDVCKLQENPELGELRTHAALLQLGIKLIPRTCGLYPRPQSISLRS